MENSFKRCIRMAARSLWLLGEIVVALERFAGLIADACVLNGAAYGQGFALCHAGRHAQSCSDIPALCELLHELVLCPIQVSSKAVALNPA